MQLDDLWPFAFGGAIFDFDGTLADSLGVWRHVDDLFFTRRGMTYNPDFAQRLSLLGFEDGARYTIDAYSLAETVEEICREWNDLGRELYETEVALREGAEVYLRALHSAGVPIAMATTNDASVVGAMEPRVPVSELLPVRVYGSEVAHKTKEHPDIYLEAARRIGVKPRDCVVFEDLPAGLICARHVGMRTVGVLTGASDQNVELLAKAADLVISDWGALAARCREAGGGASSPVDLGG